MMVTWLERGFEAWQVPFCSRIWHHKKDQFVGGTMSRHHNRTKKYTQNLSSLSQVWQNHIFHESTKPSRNQNKGHASILSQIKTDTRQCEWSLSFVMVFFPEHEQERVFFVMEMWTLLPFCEVTVHNSKSKDLRIAATANWHVWNGHSVLWLDNRGMNRVTIWHMLGGKQAIYLAFSKIGSKLLSIKQNWQNLLYYFF